ncbi:hypothetical protein F385_1524 [Pantoea agglomerans 299R]|nr:hypothetical protein F385_1524 [Pantoea agglomerans 299R]
MIHYIEAKRLSLNENAEDSAHENNQKFRCCYRTTDFF